jgi:hypothetical protein
MRAYFFIMILLAAGSAQAIDTFSTGHRVSDGDGQGVAKPMAWPYRFVLTAQKIFDERVAELAPGAVLTFRLPKVDVAQKGNQVEIVKGDRHIPLPMVSGNTFALLRDSAASQGGEMVVVNRNFPKGEFNHPIVEVRSPGLADGAKRMGDLRLACAAQMGMLKAEGSKVNALFTAASLFGLDICHDMEMTKIDDPAGHYDTVTIEDGSRHLVLPAKQSNLPRLGDKNWSDNALITYTLNNRIVQ